MRIGVVGSGGRAAACREGFAAVEGCEPVAVSARNAATGSKLARQYRLELLGDWRELVQRDDVDAVAISTLHSVAPRRSAGTASRSAVQWST